MVIKADEDQLTYSQIQAITALLSTKGGASQGSGQNTGWGSGGGSSAWDAGGSNNNTTGWGASTGTDNWGNDTGGGWGNSGSGEAWGAKPSNDQGWSNFDNKRENDSWGNQNNSSSNWGSGGDGGGWGGGGGYSQNDDDDKGVGCVLKLAIQQILQPGLGLPIRREQFADFRI